MSTLFYAIGLGIMLGIFDYLEAMSNHMTIEQMRQKASEARKEAKVLQRKLQTTTDLEERKQLARQVNDLFALAKSLRDEAKHRHYQEESIELEFLSMNADEEDD